MTGRKFLDDAYDLPDTAATTRFYDDWATSYDSEITANGYATPGRCSMALARFADTSNPVLDIGCGTGLSGLALREAGFALVDGTDLSTEMLDRARERGLYRHLFLGDLNDPLPVPAGRYGAMAAVGVINPGHAPPDTIDQVLALLPAGGSIVFSLNDHALAEPPYPEKVRTLVSSGTAELVFREHGPHLPGRNLDATVFVMRKR